MSLRARVILYLVLIHVLFATIALIVLWHNRLWLFAIEGAFVLSITLGVLLVRSFFVPLELIRTGAELIAERDFGSHFREAGNPEMDSLIGVYNRMIDTLREERLRIEEQDRLLDRVIDASPSAIVTTDFDGRIERMNPGALALSGLDAAVVAAQPIDAVDNPLFRALAALEPGESIVVPLGGYHRIRCRRAQYFDRGFPKSVYVADELTEELRRSEKAAYDKLIRMISHEVNNSGAAVRSLLESVAHYGGQLDDADREDFRTAISVASSRLENLNRFVNGFAEIVRLPEPHREPVDLGPLLRDIVTLLTPELQNRGIEIAWRVDPMPAIVDLDKNQFEQVLVNVLKNAAEAIGRDGRVSIDVVDDANRFLLTVRDTGPGVASTIESELFTPFVSTKRDGRGLGLTIAREILAQHGFEFWLRNRDEGGAEFGVRMEARIARM